MSLTISGVVVGQRTQGGSCDMKRGPLAHRSQACCFVPLRGSACAMHFTAQHLEQIYSHGMSAIAPFGTQLSAMHSMRLYLTGFVLGCVQDPTLVKHAACLQ